MVAPDAAAVAGEPERAALPEDDVAGDHELGGGFFRAEAFARAVFFLVAGCLGGV